MHSDCSNLTLHMLDNDFNTDCIGKKEPKNTYKFEHEKSPWLVVCDFNQHTVMTLHLLKIKQLT